MTVDGIVPLLPVCSIEAIKEADIEIYDGSSDE